MPKTQNVVTYSAILMVCAELLLILLSWSLAATQTEGVRSLLSSEGIRWFFGQYTEVLLRPELIWLILTSMAAGVMWRSGLLGRGDQNYRRAFALRVSLVILVFLLFLCMMLVFIPHAVLLSSTGQIWPSPFSRSLVLLLSLIAILTATAYGLISRNFLSLTDICTSFIWGIERSASLFLLYDLVFHFYESLRYVFF